MSQESQVAVSQKYRSGTRSCEESVRGELDHWRQYMIWCKCKCLAFY